MHAVRTSTTRRLAKHVLAYRDAPLPPQARQVAKQCILDWYAVTLAACDEPLVKILREETDCAGPCSIVGATQRCSPGDAALINGAASHALDYDDCHHYVGHPTVGVFPAVLAVSEWQGRSGEEALRALVAGVETSAVVGSLALQEHYERGFHGTGTLGAFGAAAATGLLLGLDEEQMTMALGLAGTQAAGLKSMFGTMAKPLHAGKAAANGVLAARLARRGFTAHDDVLDADQGFLATQGRARPSDEARFETPGGFIVETLFKYNAACYLTHSTIESVRNLVRSHGLAPDDIAAVDIHVSPRHLSVCNILDPSTGLEIKFSLRQTAALAALGVDTAAIDTYSDANANRPDAVALRERITVHGDDPGEVTAAEVQIATKSGARLTLREDVGLPTRDFMAQQVRLEEKYRSLAQPVLGAEDAERLLEAILTLEKVSDMRQLAA
jgi:2-methylcitrate dehydratase PrpD